jgi:hypothetical protein
MLRLMRTFLPVRLARSLSGRSGNRGGITSPEGSKERS